MSNSNTPLSVFEVLDDVDNGKVTKLPEHIPEGLDGSEAPVIANAPSLPVSQSIYARTAPAYLKLGIPVIPLRVKEKRPLESKWERFADMPIPPAQALTWLSNKQDLNIGLALGRQSNLVAVDIDTDDEKLIANIEKVLPNSPWVRIGQKGCVLIYRFNPAIKNKFHLYIVDSKNPDSDKGIPIVDFLTTGAQIVLPPSIHPDTQLPYIENTSLISVLDKVQEIPDNVYHLLVQAIEASGYELFRKKAPNRLSVAIPTGGRDNELTRHAGLFAQDVIRGNITLKKAFDSMQDIYDLYVQKNAHDNVDIEKHKNNIVRFIFRDLETYNKVLPVGWDRELDDKFIAALGLSIEQTELSYQQITREAKLRIEEGDSEDIYRTLEWAIAKLAQRQKPDVLQEQQLLEFLVERAKKTVNSTIKVTDLKKTLRERRKEATQSVNLDGEKLDLNSHTAVARAAIADLEQVTPILTEDKVMYKWVGTHWKVFHMDNVKHYLSTRYADIDITRRNSDFDGIFKQMLVLSHGQLSKSDSFYINVNNGVLLENGDFVPHDPIYGATYVLKYNYRPELSDKHNAPLFFKYLEDAWGKTDDYSDRLKALQEIICASCLGIATKFQRAVLLFGAAGSGKSVLLKIIAAMFPEEAKSSVSFDKLHDNSSLTMLNNKIINIVGELSNNKFIEGSIFKMVVAGEQTTGRYLFNEAFNLTPKAAHWAASNYLPKSTDSSLGFVRRWLIFSFKTAILKPDANLVDKIIASELESIFAWAIEARGRVIGADAKLTIPESSTELLEQIHMSVNPVKHFLIKDTKLAFFDTHQVAEYELYMRFRTFMFQTVGIKKIMDMNEFSQTMLELVSQWSISLFKSNDGVTYYKGIRVSD